MKFVALLLAAVACNAEIHRAQRALQRIPLTRQMVNKARLARGFPPRPPSAARGQTAGPLPSPPLYPSPRMTAPAELFLQLPSCSLVVFGICSLISL